MLDTKALAEATAVIVREHVARATAPLIDRIAALEADRVDRGMEGVKQLVEIMIADARLVAKAGRDGADGKDADPEAIARMVADAVAAIPAPSAGKDGRDGAAGADGKDGLPGADGVNGTDGKDGVGLAGMMIDRDGEAVATLTDGKMIKLGPIVGRDGRDGLNGVPGTDGRDGPGPEDFTMALLEDGRTLRIGVCRAGDETEYAFQIGFPVPIDRGDYTVGKAYEEGDIVTFDGGLWIARAATVAAPGETEDWRLAVAKGAAGADAYPGEARGLHDVAQSYRKMDTVSFNGSEWRAKQDDPGEIPGPGWMLSASKGKRGDRGERGAAGKDGVALVAQYLRGDELVTTLSDGAEFRVNLSDMGRE